MLDPKMEKLLPRASALMNDWGAAHKSIDTIKVIARNNFGFKADALDLLEREAPSDYHDAGSNVFKVIAEIENQLKESGEPQVSTSDPDSRQMIIRNNITEVAYNVQTTVDAKNNLLIDRLQGYQQQRQQSHGQYASKSQEHIAHQ